MKYFKSWRSYNNFSHIVKSKYRYIQTKETHEFLNTLLESSQKLCITIKKSTILYRAQKGYSEKEQYDSNSNTVIGYVFQPHNAERMIPIHEKSKNGRINSEGIPCLYLSDNEITAISEVGPWLNEKISLATFKLIRDLNIIDFSNIESSKLYYFNEPSPKKREKEVLSNINKAFSFPISTEDQNIEYIPTQIISEYFKINGFDGIKYSSMLSSGNNFALFNINDAIPIKGIVLSVNKISYEYDKISDLYKYF